MITAGKLVITKLIAATPEEIFEAWISPDSLRDWMTPGSTKTTEATVDPRVGGRFRIVMKDGEKDYEHSGEYQVVDRPRKLVFTWISEATGFQPTLVTVEIKAKESMTELTLTHEGLSGDAAERHHQGWSQILEKLEKHFSER
jgi:uncharacterized protein YndB with AHSA1/START domain